MKGEAHGELHKWLVPHMNLIEALSNAGSTEEANRHVEHLQASFGLFEQYFQ